VKEVFPVLARVRGTRSGLATDVIPASMAQEVLSLPTLANIRPKYGGEGARGRKMYSVTLTSQNLLAGEGGGGILAE